LSEIKRCVIAIAFQGGPRNTGHVGIQWDNSAVISADYVNFLGENY
jgi:hypothetical protein